MKAEVVREGWVLRADHVGEVSRPMAWAPGRPWLYRWSDLKKHGIRRGMRPADRDVDVFWDNQTVAAEWLSGEPWRPNHLDQRLRGGLVNHS